MEGDKEFASFSEEEVALPHWGALVGWEGRIRSVEVFFFGGPFCGT